MQKLVAVADVNGDETATSEGSWEVQPHPENPKQTRLFYTFQLKTNLPGGLVHTHTRMRARARAHAYMHARMSRKHAYSC